MQVCIILCLKPVKKSFNRNHFCQSTVNGLNFSVILKISVSTFQVQSQLVKQMVVDLNGGMVECGPPCFQSLTTGFHGMPSTDLPGEQYSYMYYMDACAVSCQNSGSVSCQNSGSGSYKPDRSFLTVTSFLAAIASALLTCSTYILQISFILIQYHTQLC